MDFFICWVDPTLLKEHRSNPAGPLSLGKTGREGQILSGKCT